MSVIMGGLNTDRVFAINFAGLNGASLTIMGVKYTPV